MKVPANGPSTNEVGDAPTRFVNSSGDGGAWLSSVRCAQAPRTEPFARPTGRHTKWNRTVHFPHCISPMPTPPASASSAGVVLPAFEDGLGKRYRPTGRAGDTPPEILC